MTHAAARSLVSDLWGRALDLIFPPRCVSCHVFGGFLCEECLACAVRANPPRCSICWMPEESQAVCWRCRKQRPALSGARSAFVYGGEARDAVHAFKFRGVSALAPLMARVMVTRLIEWAPPVETLVPVPLSGRRRRLRGYNQSELLAREIARETGLRLDAKALVRRINTAPQVGQPDEESRQRNVAGAFALGAKHPLGGVLLVDDVMTTGATLDACATVLTTGGAEPVFALTFARED